MKVKDIMTKDVVSVKEGATLKEVNSILVKNDISGLPVVDEGGRVIGVITEDDLIRAILPSYQEITSEEMFLQDAENIEKNASEASKRRVKDIMSKNPITVDEEMPVMKAGAIMLARKVKRLPVVRDGKLVGVVSRTNITQHMLK
jgi:CBS domain-containing protein